MANIVIYVKSKDKTYVGWDVYCLSWRADEQALITHHLVWDKVEDGIFAGTSDDLPCGVYGVYASVTGVGRKISVGVKGAHQVLQPDGAEWPLEVDIDGSTSTQAADTWYFEHRNGERFQ